MPNPAKPQERVEEKKLTDGQKYRLLNVHLNDRIIQLERELAGTIQQVGNLKEEVVNLKRQIHEANTDIFFKELGISRGEPLTLNDDGTLLIRRQVAAKLPKPAKRDEESKEPANGSPEILPAEAAQGA